MFSIYWLAPRGGGLCRRAARWARDQCRPQTRNWCRFRRVLSPLPLTVILNSTLNPPTIAATPPSYCTLNLPAAFVILRGASCVHSAPAYAVSRLPRLRSREDLRRPNALVGAAVLAVLPWHAGRGASEAKSLRQNYDLHGVGNASYGPHHRSRFWLARTKIRQSWPVAKRTRKPWPVASRIKQQKSPRPPARSRP